MTRRFLAIAVAIAALASAACGQQALPEPAKPPPPAEPRTRVDRTVDEQPPKLIAPPPAYGNKVVMAKAGSAKGRF